MKQELSECIALLKYFITEYRRLHKNPSDPYIVYVDDNYHFMDEEERYRLGEFATEQEAIAAAKSLIDRFLEDARRPGSTAESLYSEYVNFGEDPFIPGVHFSAWDYAKQRSLQLGEQNADSQPESDD